MILIRWALSRFVEMAVGSMVLITISDYMETGAVQIYEVSNYIQGFGLIGFGYFVSGYFILSLYFSFQCQHRYVRLSLINVVTFTVVSILTGIMGISLEPGLVVYVAQGALIFISSLVFGAAFSAPDSDNQ